MKRLFEESFVKNIIKESISRVLNEINNSNDDAFIDCYEREDEITAFGMVQNSAKNAGAVCDEQGRPIHLYHGTSKFGFTKFLSKRKSGAMFTTNKRYVSANYAGDSNYASVRKINKGYSTDGDLLRNASSVFDRKYRFATEKEKEESIKELEIAAKEVAKNLDALESKCDDNSFPQDNNFDDIWNLISTVEDIVYTAAFGRENGNENEDMARNLKQDCEWYNDSIGTLSQYYHSHSNELGNEAKSFIQYLIGYHVSDIVADAKNVINAFSPNNVATVDGKEFLDQETLQGKVDKFKNIGSYDLFGFLGENPLTIDAMKRDWCSIDFKNEQTSTDRLAEVAKERGYTSLVIKNVYDYGDLSDVYVFFTNSQLKSADPFTFDDNGSLIPLSERFDFSNQDIRY